MKSPRARSLLLEKCVTGNEQIRLQDAPMVSLGMPFPEIQWGTGDILNITPD